MKAYINIGVQPGTKLLRIQRQSSQWIEREIYDSAIKMQGHWIIWLNTKDYINGTFLKLYDDGKIERITVRVDEPNEDVMLIKPSDGG